MRITLLSIGLLTALAPFSANANVLRLTGRNAPHAPLTAEFDLQQQVATPNTLTCTEVGGRAERHVLRGKAARRQQLRLAGFKASTRYRCQAHSLADGATSNQVLIETAALPQDMPVPVVTQTTTDPVSIGYTLYNVGNITYEGDISHDFDNSLVRLSNNYLTILDPEGNVRWFLKGPGGGDLDVTYLGDDRILFGGESMPIYPPTIVDLYWSTEFIGLSTPVDSSETPLTYNHDAGLSPDGKSIFTLVFSEPPDAEDRGFIIKEIGLGGVHNNELLWSWKSEDAVARGDLSPDLPWPTDPNDPFHCNSLWTTIEDGRLYIYLSIRNTSEIVKIDHQTGDIVWHLGYDGDFTLLDEDGSPAALDQWFYNQHDVKVIDGVVTLVDNGFDRQYVGGELYSRAMRLVIDEEEMTARINWTWTEAGWVEPLWGGIDVLPNNTANIAMAHCGFCELTDHTTTLINVDTTNQAIRWRADFPNNDTMVYRSERIDGCDIFSLESMCPTGTASTRAAGAARAIPASHAPRLQPARR